MASVVGEITIEVAAEAVCTGLPLSVAVAVKFEVPDWVGTPEIVPVEAVRVSPTGRLPEVIDHL
jgi:hypothetical protein